MHALFRNIYMFGEKNKLRLMSLLKKVHKEIVEETFKRDGNAMSTQR